MQICLAACGTSTVFIPKDTMLATAAMELCFAEDINQYWQIKKKDKEVPASKELAPDLETIIPEVSRYYETKPATLRSVRRGIENEPRDVALYLIRSMRAEPLIRVAAGLG
jgi:chromosomal replication initiation ATPase DnaA